MTPAAWLFWPSAVWIGYVWIGYPLALEVLSVTRRFCSITADDYYPKVSVLIAARNEQKDIGWKLAQTLAWDYPADRLEVLVGSEDGPKTKLSLEQGQKLKHQPKGLSQPRSIDRSMWCDRSMDRSCISEGD